MAPEKVFGVSSFLLHVVLSFCPIGFAVFVVSSFCQIGFVVLVALGFVVLSNWFCRFVVSSFMLN